MMCTSDDDVEVEEGSEKCTKATEKNCITRVYCVEQCSQSQIYLLISGTQWPIKEVLTNPLIITHEV